jgi:hypothetical protein
MTPAAAATRSRCRPMSVCHMPDNAGNVAWLALRTAALRSSRNSPQQPSLRPQSGRFAEIEGKTGWREIGQFLLVQAREFYERGDQKGENSALLVSIEIYRALQDLTRERDPLLWAATTTSGDISDRVRYAADAWVALRVG